MTCEEVAELLLSMTCPNAIRDLFFSLSPADRDNLDYEFVHNPNTPEDVLVGVVRAGGSMVFMELLRRPGLEPSSYQQIITKKGWMNISWFLGECVNADTYPAPVVVDLLSKSTSPVIRKNIARLPVTNLQTLVVLAEDPNPEVQDSAIMSIEHHHGLLGLLSE